MAEYTPQAVQMILIIPKSFEIAIYIILFVLLYKRLMTKPPEQRYILNKLFLFSFLMWSIYMICDTILYPLGAVPFTNNAALADGTSISGYPKDYPEIYWAQILRDIALSGGFAMTYAYLASAMVIKNGEIWTKEHYFGNKIANGIGFIIIVLLVAGDRIESTKAGDQIWVREQWGSPIGAISLILMIGFLFYAAATFFKTIMNMGASDPGFRRRTKFIGIGILVFAMGGVFWMALGLISSNVTLPDVPYIFLMFVGHGIWTVAPILMYTGLKS